MNQVLKIFYFCSVYNWKIFYFENVWMRRRFTRFVLLKNGIGPLSIDPIRVVVLMKLSFYLLRKLYFPFSSEEKWEPWLRNCCAVHFVIQKLKIRASKRDIKGHFEKSKSNCINGSYIYRTWWQGMNLCYCFPSFFPYQWM